MFQQWLGNQLRHPKGPLSKWVGMYMQKGNDEINLWTIDLLNLDSDKVLLEVGIGNGSTLNRIASNKKVRKLYGVDLSDDMIKEAAKLNKKFIENGMIELQQGNVLFLPYKESTIDTVLSVHTIYFWTDIDQGLSDIHRVLKPGGKLFLSITDKSRMEQMERTKDFHLIHIEEIEKKLSNHLFQPIELHQKGMHWCIEATKQ